MAFWREENAMVDNNSCACPVHVTRRGFISSMAAVGAATALPGCSSMMMGDPSKRPLVDVHHHFYPPEFSKAVMKFSGGGGPPAVLKWTPAATLDEMDRNNVSMSFLSLWSIPGVWMKAPPEGMRRYARMVNDYGAQMVRDKPGRFGLFAALPLPDVEGSLREIEYAFDVLKADGVGLMTNFGDKWPGDPAYAPVFNELNRRKATVYFHPVALTCCGGNFMPNVGESWLEVPYDTGRAVMSLLTTGTLNRLQDIKWIFSHSGGTVPIIIERVKQLGSSVAFFKKVAPNGIDAEIKRLYFETANGAHKPNMAALLSYVPASQVMFGTDYPYLTTAANSTKLREYGLSNADLTAIEYGNAQRLFPRIKV
jgi:predicted TIM-barrel fold metal-dependent hydrolase